ncbi:MAG: DUF1217 domain-containing protein [Rhodobacteraceae bacterium]|nr:DUF1217 domain-containing protein [Paracoccaceae bacterium]TVR48662.1 MAG: DUF1217 domain-containing protein [Paracoccaceae bacterium]
MSFAPVIPMTGLAGWAFLDRTRERQEDSFAQSPSIARVTQTFTDRIGKIETAEDLVGDRQVLQVALGAFGLQDDLDSRAFIRRILEDGVEDRAALANRLTDKRYLAFATAFAHLAPGATGSAPDDLADRIVQQFKTRSFEVAVGEQDQTMRLAMTLDRELPQLLSQYQGATARWLGALGNPPLREVLETALGLPREFGALDVDEQVKRMRAAAQRQFGTSEIEDLAEPGKLEEVTRRFLIMSDLKASQSAMTGAATALTLLQNMRR